MSIHYSDEMITLHHGHALDVLRGMPDGTVNCCVTSPPYFGLRDYGEPGQYGLEKSPAEYVENMRVLFTEVHRVLTDDGTLWLNLGDSYSGKTKWLPEKNLLGIPWRVAFALQDDGWILRSDIIWVKPSSMPENVRDRPTSAHEHVFLLAKSPRYYYDSAAIAETATGQASGNGFRRNERLSRGGPDGDHQWDGRKQLRRAQQLAREKGLTEQHFAAIRSVGMSDAGKARAQQRGSGRNAADVQRLADEAKEALGGYYREFLTGATRNARNVWMIGPEPFPAAHFAVFPSELPRCCIATGCKPGGTVLDPFSGSGTTGLAAGQLGRKYVGIDLSAKYLDLSLRTRLAQTALLNDDGR